MELDWRRKPDKWTSISLAVKGIAQQLNFENTLKAVLSFPLSPERRFIFNWKYRNKLKSNVKQNAISTKILLGLSRQSNSITLLFFQSAVLCDWDAWSSLKLQNIWLIRFLTYITFKMMSSNGNISRFTSPLCGEFTGHRWILITMASDGELWCFLWTAHEQTCE